MANKIVREIIHAKGIDIGIYTKDFENEYISLTDIAKYRYDNDPRFAIPVYSDCGELERYNIFKARLLIRHAASGKKSRKKLR